MNTQTYIAPITHPKTLAGRLRTACTTPLLPLLLLLALPAVVEAQFNCIITNGTITITKYTGPGGAVTIPDTINGLPVISIGFEAFCFCSNLTSVTIPNTVTDLGDRAFIGCRMLTRLTLGSGVTSIGDWTFQACGSLTNVTIPNSVNGIGIYAFSGCISLTNVTIGNGVTSIGDLAFYECTSLTDVAIPNSVTNMGSRVFQDCTSLTGLTVDAFNPVYSSADGVLFNKSQTTLVEYPCAEGGGYTIPTSVTSIGDYAFNGCTSLTSVTIPDSVTNVADGAFAWCTSLASVTIGHSVTWIGDYGFADCPILMGVYFKGNAPSLGSDVFYLDTSATVYYLPGTTGWSTTFGGRPTVLWQRQPPGAWTLSASTITPTGATLNGTVNPNGWPTTAWFQWGTTTNYGNLTSATGLGSGTTALPLSAPLAGLTLGVTYHFRIAATNDNGLVYGSDQSFTTSLSPTVMTLPAAGVSTNSATLNGTVNPEGYPTGAWFQWGTTTNYGNATTATDMGSGTNALPLSAPLAVLTPGTIYHFRAAATNGLNPVYGGDQSFTTATSPTEFNYTINNGTITITGYTGPGGAVIIPSVINDYPVTAIGVSAFGGCTSLTSITIPNSVTSIGEYAFWECYGLTNVSIGINVTSIGGGAFHYCSSLTAITVAALNSTYSSVDGVLFNKSQTTLILCPGVKAGSYIIPNSVINILDDAFDNCASLTSITIPNSVANIEGRTFFGCTSLASVSIGNSVTSIGEGAFASCFSLTSITIPNSVASIGEQAFASCHSLTNVSIGINVTSIGSTAFDYCGSLTAITVDALNSTYSSVDGVLFNKSLTTLLRCPQGKAGSCIIPDSVTSIGYQAFVYCSSLTSVSIPNSVTDIGSSAFWLCSSLTDITIPNGVASIGIGSFSQCSGLGSVTIGNSVTSIGNGAFSDCPLLTRVYFLGNAPSADSTAFYFDNATVYYLPGTTGWGSTFCGLPTALWQSPPPGAWTLSASSVTTTSATLNGTVTPNGWPAIAWFQWGTTTNYGNLTSVTALGSGIAALPVSAPLAGLTPRVTYHFCVAATNDNGLVYGSDQSFTTLGPPQVSTLPAAAVSTESATLNGTVNPNGWPTTAWFQWGTTTNYGNLTPATDLGNATTALPLSASLAGLTPRVTYHFRLAATNDYGLVCGRDQSFTTTSLLPPQISTLPATAVTVTTATLNGTVNPNGYLTTAWFQWGATTNYGNLTSATDLGSGTTALPFSAPLSGLTLGVTYHFRTAATNENGLVYGSDQSFTTASLLPPQVSTLPATGVTPNSTTLNGTVNPSGYPTTACFQSGTTTSYGNLTAATALGSGTTALRLSAALAGLNPGVTYHFRIAATNDNGLAYGSDESFTTQTQSGGAGWTLNGGATMTGNTIALTVGAGGTSRSAFLNNKQDVTAFHIMFFYQDVSGAGSADGVTFCIQNDPRGATALGGGSGGSSLGYENITPSVALAMNIYAPNGRGVALFQNGAVTYGYASLLPDVDIGGNTNIIQVNVDYNGTVMTMTFKDTVTGGIASTNWTVNIPSVVGGSTAYVGFTGADGGVASIQTISWAGSTPTILIPPRTQTAEAGSAVGLSVHASGSLPLSFLWYLNDTNLISWSTNSDLELTNVQISDSGAYTVVVTNVAGAVTSAPVLLSVIAAVERRPVPGVKLIGEAGSLLSVDYADSLGPAPNWSMLGSVSLTTASQYYFDLTLPLPPQRFYRAWQTGAPSVMPSLDLHMIPAITLTGTIGGSVRLDYINRFGPTDAWVSLDTVTLTNTSQLYFDVSAPGQLPRLYRLVPSP